MAKILNTSNHMEKYLHEISRKSALNTTITTGLALAFLCLMVIFFAAGRYEQSLFSFFCILIIFGIGSIYSLFKGTSKEQILIKKSGIAGEKEVLSILSSLPEDYTVISDLCICVDDKKSQLDHVVVGTNGIFIIEAKNLKGQISGSSKDKMLKQIKVSRNGEMYLREFYNPVKQVSTHVHRLSKLLKKIGVDVWVQGVVYFSDFSAEVLVCNDKVPIFSCKNSGEAQLKQLLASFSKEVLTAEEKENICHELQKYII